MNQNTQRELQARIEAFATDITEILQRAVADSLTGALGKSGAGGGRGRGAGGGNGASGRGAGGRAAKKAGGRGRGGRGGAADEGAVLKELSKEPGRRVTQIAEALGLDSKSVGKTLKALVANKKAKSTGQARGTKYTAI